MKDLTKSVEVITEILPETKAIILSRSGVDGSYIEGSSDLDLLVIGNEVEDLSDKLKEIQDKLGEKFDINYITPEGIVSGFIAINLHREYQYHGMDLYRLKDNFKVIYGDEDLLKLIPNVTLQEALDDILPYLRNTSILSLKQHLQDSSDATNFIHQECKNLIVLIRTVFTLATNRIGSKLEALDYFKGEFPQYTATADLLRSIYLKEQTQIEINKDETKDFILKLEELLGREDGKL